MRSIASAARAASTPATSLTRWRFRPSSSIPSRPCSPPTAWDSPTSPPSARKGSTSRFESMRFFALAPSRTSSPPLRSRRSKGKGSRLRRSKSIAARSCAIRDRIRRSRFRSRRRRRCGAGSKARTKAASASSIVRRRSSSRRCPSRRSAARLGQPREPAIGRVPRPRRSFPPAERASSRRGAGARRMSFYARRLPSARASMGRRLSSSRIRRSSSNRVGAPSSQRETMC